MGLKKYTGGAWNDTEVLKRNSGGSWAECEAAKRWNGSAWVPVWENYENGQFVRHIVQNFAGIELTGYDNNALTVQYHVYNSMGERKAWLYLDLYAAPLTGLHVEFDFEISSDTQYMTPGYYLYSYLVPVIQTDYLSTRYFDVAIPRETTPVKGNWPHITTVPPVTGYAKIDAPGINPPYILFGFELKTASYSGMENKKITVTIKNLKINGKKYRFPVGI